MIKMVSQFEDEKMRASVATPTCGPCCCSSCCSCVVTILVSSVITARNFGRIAEKQVQEKSLGRREVVVAKEKMFATLLGFFALPLSLGVLFFVLEKFKVTEIVVDWLYWIFIEPLMLDRVYAYFLMFAFLHMFAILIVRLKYKISLIHALLIVLLTIVFIRLEIEVWSYFISLI